MLGFKYIRHAPRRVHRGYLLFSPVSQSDPAHTKATGIAPGLFCWNATKVRSKARLRLGFRLPFVYPLLGTSAGLGSWGQHLPHPELVPLGQLEWQREGKISDGLSQHLQVCASPQSASQEAKQCPWLTWLHVVPVHMHKGTRWVTFPAHPDAFDAQTSQSNVHFRVDRMSTSLKALLLRETKI